MIMHGTIYKILPFTEWRRAKADGAFAGSRVDLEDGYIHFSTAAQVRETAAKHFAGQGDLVLLAVDADRLPPDALRWEPSRGGQLFPHLYQALDTAWVLRAEPLPLEGGVHRFPDALA